MTSDREQISGFPETRRYRGAEGRDYSGAQEMFRENGY